MTTIPTTMRAIEIAAPGEPETLRLCTRPVPTPRRGEALIRVSWAGVNRPDVMQRRGLYPPPPGASDLPGLEVSGEIVALHKRPDPPASRTGLSAAKIGDSVCALVNGGGYSEYCLAPLGHCLPVPARLSPREAAALPENFFTVWTNLVERARFWRGEALLVHGGSSGIGLAAISLVTHVLGGRAFATAGSDEKCAACVRHGAKAAFNYRTGDFVEAMRKEGGADVILDMVAGDYLARNIQCLNTEGRLVIIAFQHGAKVEHFNFLDIMMRRLTITGSTLRPRTIAQKTRIARALRRNLWPLLESGKIEPVIAASFPLAQASEAHRLMESSTHIGKILLQCA